jgi:two-component system LytT family sensor kinase
MTTIDLSDPIELERPWRAFFVWTAIALVYAAILHYQVPLPLIPALASALQYFYVLALVMIPVRRWNVRLLNSPRPPWQIVLVELAIGIVAIAIWISANLAFHRLEVGPDFWQYVYAGNWLFQLLSAIVIYVATVGVNVASIALARDRERTRRQHEMEVATRDAELAAMKAQFQPHFVLNSLNSLLALIDADPALARTMVVRLADLMKSVFDRIDVGLVPFERELDMVRAYLDVERIRLGTRLTVTFNVDDAARGVMVPPFLLQPIVENAVKHGVSPFAGPGLIEIRAGVNGRNLCVIVSDSGRKGQPAVAGSTGRGLMITRSRLDGMYGTNGYRLTMSPGLSGTSVEMQLPAEQNVA